MSCGPPVSGRVNAIKSQFESLSNLESVDLNSTNIKVKSPIKHSFQRAVTSIDLKKRSENSANCAAKWTKTDVPPKQPSEYNRLKETHRKSVVDSSAIKIKQAEVQDERMEVKLSRHTSDPSKRSSIRRSPAFRVGDKHNNKSTVSVKPKVIVPSKDLVQNEKFEFFLQNKCVTDMDRLKQPGLTDSLKFALRQPLPAGPPPKKPPRSFLLTSSSDDGDVSPSKDITPIEIFKKQSFELKAKINYLENSLFTNKNTNTNSIRNAQPPKLQKCKTEILQGSKLLDCLSCHKNMKNVYDTVEVDERKPLMQSNTNKTLMKRFTNSIKPAEPIYMEPFSHLKDKITGGCDIIMEEAPNTSSTSAESNEESINETICSCPENHNGQSDLHYLCTAISDSVEDSDITDNFGNDLSLGKTYDEITILVDAAFQQNNQEKENNTVGNRNYSNSNSNNNNDSLADSSRNSTSSAVRLSRTLTEKRKDYVRRVAVLPENHQVQNYGTIQNTFKSPVIRTFSLENKYSDNENILSSSQSNELVNEMSEKSEEVGPSVSVSLNDRIDNYKKLIEENATKKFTSQNNCDKSHVQNAKRSIKNLTRKGDVDSDNVKNENSQEEDEILNGDKLFQVCLLIGYNTSTQSAYLKSKYPPNEAIPDNIEQLVFPSYQLVRSGRENQEYCLILTDDNAFKVYGYCRRVLPENFDICLPLCYCILTVTKALGFYQKLLKEIESRHGQSETQWNCLLKNLQNSKLPEAGKYLHIKLPLNIRPKTYYSSNTKISPNRLSLEVNPKWLTESSLAAATAAASQNVCGGLDQIQDEQKSFRRPSGQKSLVQEYEEKKQQTSFDLTLINRSLLTRDPKFDEILIRRPNDLRLENVELSELLIALGAELLMNVFSTLLHERKVILQGKNISLLSKSILALQTILYPFQWQYIIVTILPKNLIEICQAPFPVLAGVLEDITFDIEDGIVVDMDNKKIIQNCGDERSILPGSLRQSLQLSLEMVDLIDQGKMLSGVLISEAFLRFFVELFGDYRKKYFNKEEFINCHKSHELKFFLEWFLETSMFRYFCNEKYQDQHCYNNNNNNNNRSSAISLATNSIYNLFDARLMEKSENTTKTIKNIETIVKNSKIINKKGKSFGKRFKEFLNHN